MPKLIINGQEKEYPRGTTFEEIAHEYQPQYKNQIVAVIYGSRIRELMKKVDRDENLSFITTADEIGNNTYTRTALMMLIKAVRDVAGRTPAQTIIDYKVGNAFYCRVKADFKVSEVFAEQVQKRMEEMVQEMIPITKKGFPLADAVDIFGKEGMEDKVRLLRYRRSSEVNVYKLDDFSDYFYGYMLPNTSYIKWFKVEKHHEGLLLNLPSRKHPDEITESEPREKLFTELVRSTNWGEMMGVETVGDLNDAVCRGDFDNLMLVQEALQERRIGEIAQKIYESKHVRFVMIAGPSSSGKTSFANRLSIQMRTYGLNPHPISLDNYFVNREKTPLNEDGSYNFECLEALDVEQFNKDMVALLNGEEVELPTFNFVTGKREMNGDYMKLNPGDVLVIEGIHGLNEKMSYALPSESKFKIYISALTTLSVDAHNRIPTTDGRLIRRIVRDARTRGATAKHTIAMWDSVRRGEEQNIFPFQESADEMFNSAQIYELAVLKQYAEPLLFAIKPEDPEFFEAKRLLKFLDYFVAVDSQSLPKNSITREFVGGSCFNV
ncbi:MAG: nucleoside kinase [Butyrivibrio sp.]|nr:nucleoside kinase [Butyrivibrio sp.]